MTTINHSTKAREFLQNQTKAQKFDSAVWWLRQNRDQASYAIPEFQELRNLASQIKSHTLSHLDQYLIEFETNALKNGIQVHWAQDALEHNQIVLAIIQKNQATRIVKSKSMLTEECHLNPFLEKHGLDVVDTDLGERIIQFRKEPPSHIVMPALHLSRQEIGKTFHEHIGSPENETDPANLTYAARVHLREKFLNAEIAITGVNFAIANTGNIVVCTNEGNADLGVAIAPIHIASMGLEKIIPDLASLGVFTRLLARSATGSNITGYTSHFAKPISGRERHIIIVDNGRSQQLAKAKFRDSLKCIRCGACMNTCPVYRRSGGYSYQAVIPGPIGAILSPNHNLAKHSDLPFASSLCGSCTDVCPVKINIHEQLYNWRQVITNTSNVSSKSSRWLITAMALVLTRPNLYMLSGKLLRLLLRTKVLNNRLNPWCRGRELPHIPKQSFREIYKQKVKSHD